MPGELVTQAFLLGVMEQINERFDGGHSRVRQSLNELRADMKSGFAHAEHLHNEHESRLRTLSEELLQLLHDREAERDIRKVRREDYHHRLGWIAVGISTAVTLILFAVRAIFKL